MKMFFQGAVALMFVLFSAFGAVAQTIKYKNPEPFAKQIFTILQKGQSIEKHYLNQGDVPTIIEVMLNSAEAKEAGMTREELAEDADRHFARFMDRKLQNQEELDEINWQNAELKLVLFEVKKHADNMYEAEFRILFTYEDKDWKLDVDDCLLLPRGWVLGDRIRVREVAADGYGYAEEATEETVEDAEELEEAWEETEETIEE